MKAPFVSVLIDTCNYGEFIEEAVSSALAQDFPAAEREILVVDDGSTDDTQERLRKFGEAIRYLRKPIGGQASAFNSGATPSAPMRTRDLTMQPSWSWTAAARGKRRRSGTGTTAGSTRC